MVHRPVRRPTVSCLVAAVGVLGAVALPGCRAGQESGGGSGTSAGSTTPGSTTPGTAAPGTASPATRRPGSTAPGGSVPMAAAPDYADPANWLSQPTPTAHGVDVFYLYPTVWSRPGGTGPITASVDDGAMRAGAQGALRGQASAFAPVANIFAPYYRQASAEVLALSPDERQAIVGGIPTSDAVAAFDYYLRRLNQSRPFFLAGHSQGSNLLVNLLAGYLAEHPDAYARMIAAYVIGYSVTSAYLAQNRHLRFAERADDVGVIVSYNTEAPGVTGNNPVVLPGALAINPISWTRTAEDAPATGNLGSYVATGGGAPAFVDGLADAQIDPDRGVVLCRTCDVNTYSNPNPAVPRGVFHANDYAFYYFDLRVNAAARVAAWTRR